MGVVKAEEGIAAATVEAAMVVATAVAVTVAAVKAAVVRVVGATEAEARVEKATVAAVIVPRPSQGEPEASPKRAKLIMYAIHRLSRAILVSYAPYSYHRRLTRHAAASHHSHHHRDTSTSGPPARVTLPSTTHAIYTRYTQLARSAVHSSNEALPDKEVSTSL